MYVAHIYTYLNKTEESCSDDLADYGTQHIHYKTMCVYTDVLLLTEEKGEHNELVVYC